MYLIGRWFTEKMADVGEHSFLSILGCFEVEFLESWAHSSTASPPRIQLQHGAFLSFNKYDDETKSKGLWILIFT